MKSRQAASSSSISRGTAFVAGVLVLVTCFSYFKLTSDPPEGTISPDTSSMGEFVLTSPDFESGNPIPRKYTKEGDPPHMSPPLSWSNAPPGTQSFVLTVDDPDAPGGSWDHWILYDIPPDVNHLSPSTKGHEIPVGTRQGKNGSGHIGYYGPSPPSGTHRYFFTVYALDKTLGDHGAPSKSQLIAEIERQKREKKLTILGEAQLMGTYKMSGH
eukprot:jgi/Mesvir1/12284/Mv00490-RA.1